MTCINVSHPDYKKLEAQSTLAGFELEIAVSKWQDQNNTDVFPTIDQLESTDSLDTEVKEQLLEVLNKNGISVTSMQEYMSNYKLRTGKNITVKALADTARKIIAYDNDSSLPEEAMHMAVASQVGTFDFNRALRLVEQTDEYKNNYETYETAYSSLEGETLDRKIRIEILGKIGAERLIQNLKSGRGTGIWKYLNRIWNKFKSIFDSSKVELEQILDKWASSFVEGTTPIQDEGVFFEAEESELTEAEELYKNLLKGMLSRAKYFDKLGGYNTDAFKEEYYELLETEHIAGMFKFVKNMQQDIKATLAKINKFNDKSLTFTSKDYRDMKLMIDYYQPYTESIKYIFATELANQDVLTDKQIKKLNKRLDAAIKNLSFIAKFHRVNGEKLAKQWAKAGAEDAISDPQVLEEEKKIIDKTIRYVDYDSNFFLKLFGSLVHAKDSFQKILHYHITKIRREVDNFSYNLGKDLTMLSDKLKIKDTSKFIEKDNTGKFTHYFIDKFKFSSFKKEQDDFHKKIHTDFGLPEDKTKRNGIKRQWRIATREVEKGNTTNENLELSKKLKDYDERVAKWYSRNTMPINNWQDRVEQVKKELGGGNTEAFQAWHKINIGIGKKGTKFEYEYPKGELVTPSDGRIVKRGKFETKTVDWTNPEYNKLTSNEIEYLNKLLDVMEEADKKHGRTRHRLQLPQVKASTADLVIQTKFRNIFENIRDLAKTAEDDTEFGDTEKVMRPDGTMAQFVPVYFINKLNNPDQLSPDLTASVLLYADMAENFKQMSTNQPMFDLVLDTIGNRVVKLKGKPVTGKETVVYQSMEKFIEMNVFGQWKEHLVVGGWNITKIMNNLVKYVTVNNLGLSLYTTLASYFTSATYSKIEDLVGQYTTQKDKNKAESIWDKNIHQTLVEAGKINKTNKLGLFFESHRVLKKNQDIFKNLDKNRLTRKALNSGLFFSYELVKLRIRGKLALAIASNYKYYNNKFYTTKELENQGVDTTNLKSYYDLIEVKDGKIIANHNDTTIQDKIERKIEYIGNNIDGELSYSDWSAAHQSALGQLVTTHRGWLFRNIQLRLKPSGVNYQTGEKEEGFYLSFYDFMKKTFLSPGRIFSYKEHLARWEELTPMQKQGVLRTAWEIAFIHAVATLALILNNLADDEPEEDALIQHAAYVSNRVLLELGALNPTPKIAVDPVSGDFAYSLPLISSIKELTAILNSPVAATRQIDDLIDLTNLMSTEEVESGPYKGMTKQERAIIKLLPGMKGLYQARDPKSRNAFLKMKTLKWMSD